MVERALSETEISDLSRELCSVKPLTFAPVSSADIGLLFGRASAAKKTLSREFLIDFWLQKFAVC